MLGDIIRAKIQNIVWDQLTNPRWLVQSVAHDDMIQTENSKTDKDMV